MEVKPSPPSPNVYQALLIILMVYSVSAGYLAAIQGGGWRRFSWHPLFMTVGLVGLMGGAILTKKRGGYFNTKMHGIFSWVGLLTAFVGLYVVYSGKNSKGYQHFQSTHAKVGLGVMVACVGAGMAGGIFLHPDFGVDKTNKQIRSIHKLMSRAVLVAGWMTAVLGLTQNTSDLLTIAIYGVPLVGLVPFVLV